MLAYFLVESGKLRLHYHVVAIDMPISYLLAITMGYEHRPKKLHPIKVILTLYISF